MTRRSARRQRRQDFWRQRSVDKETSAAAKRNRLFGSQGAWRRAAGCVQQGELGGVEGELVKQNLDATLRELGELSGVKCSVMAVWRTLKKLGCRRKKVALRCGTGQAGRQGEA